MSSVLSIDWDYFIDATADQRYKLFPDGETEDLSFNSQMTIWLGRYAYYDDLSSIHVKEGELHSLYDIVTRLKKGSTRLIVGESHIDIVSLLRDTGRTDTPIYLANIDFQSKIVKGVNHRH